MLTTYVVNRMHHITICFFVFVFVLNLAQSDLREALIVLKHPVDHRSHTLDCCLGVVTQATVKSFLWAHFYAYLSS